MEALNDIAKNVTFESFCKICEAIKHSKGHQSKSDILSKYFNECRLKNGNATADADLYPILRLFLPQAERERNPYGIKEATFARLYIRVLNLPKNGNDALKLLNYKAPASSATGIADFAEVAYWVLKSRCGQNSSTISIDDINTHLDNLASFHGNNTPRLTENELTKLINSLPVMQQKWLIRIILKDLKLGIGQAKILTSFHNDASDLFDSTNSLLKVCSTLKNPDVHLHEIEVEIFSPFRPMLSERLDISKINVLMKKQNFYLLETKFDGERFQIHMRNGEFKYFSRNGYDYTDQYGKSYNDEGMLTKKLQELIDSSVFSFIIDGEMMGWHKRKKAFSSKGINFDVKKISDQSVFQACFCAFDILLLNDVILTNKPLIERLPYLDKLFRDKEGVIIHSVTQEVQGSDKILEALNNAIDNQDEGIVIKIVDSFYKPNSRKAGWYKIKPEYTDGVMNEMDFLIIGGYYAENKQYGMINSVLLGVAVFADEKDKYPTSFYACGKVKLTVVREELMDLCNKLQPHWNVYNKDVNPPTIYWTKDKPDVWIEPKNSIIVQVKASELIRTNEFKTSYTLRFPRVEKIRYDKPWYDCLKLEEFNKLTQYSHGVEKLTSRNIMNDELENSSTTSPRKKTMIRLGAQFLPTVLTDLQEKSNIFGGKEFCIMSGNAEITKSALEIKVQENGGHIVQNPGVRTFCIVAGNINARITNAIKCGEHNVATIDWLTRALGDEYIKSGSFLEWTPQDLIGKSKETSEEFAIKYDEFGDSYTAPATRASLNYSMERVDESDSATYILPVEILEMDKILFGGVNPYSFMRLCRIYFIDSDEFYDFTYMQKIQLQLLKIDFQLYAGTCCDSIDEDTTHVVVLLTSDTDCIMKTHENLRDNKYTAIIVSVDWLYQCLEEKCLLDSDEYVLK